MKSTKTKSAFGASRFVNFVHDWGHPEWMVILAETSLENVTAWFKRQPDVAEVFENVPIGKAKDNDDTIAPLIYVVQSDQSQWTAIYLLVCVPIESQDVREASIMSKSLSAQLNARTIFFFGEDTSYAMHFELIDGDKVVQTGDEEQSESFDREFSKLKVALPACYPCLDRKKTRLACVDSSEHLKRADLIRKKE